MRNGNGNAGNQGGNEENVGNQGGNGSRSVRNQGGNGSRSVGNQGGNVRIRKGMCGMQKINVVMREMEWECRELG